MDRELTVRIRMTKEHPAKGSWFDDFRALLRCIRFTKYKLDIHDRAKLKKCKIQERKML